MKQSSSYIHIQLQGTPCKHRIRLSFSRSSSLAFSSELVFTEHQFSDEKLGKGADATVYKLDRSGTLQWVGQLGCSITAWPLTKAFSKGKLGTVLVNKIVCFLLI